MMAEERPRSSDKTGLRIQREAGLANLLNGGSPALSEIVNRSLVHIQTSKALGMRHRVGEQELFGPDYRLVCAFAEDLRLTPEEVLRRLMLTGGDSEHRYTRIKDGRFEALHVDKKALPISFIPSIDGLIVAILELRLQKAPSRLDLSMFPNLKELYCWGNQLTELDLSQISNLTSLCCQYNQLTELDLSQVPDLTSLCCEHNQLTYLDLSKIPHLTVLSCHDNQLTELDLSNVPSLLGLWCNGNQLR